MVARQRLDLPGATTGLQRRLARQERNAPLGFSSITRGGLRVQSPDGIQVKTVAGGAPGMRVTGLQIVEGTLRITGTLEGGGTWSWTGPWVLAGNGTISGNVTATGTLTVNGPWNLNGAGKIQGDVEVLGAGKVRVGNMIIDPTISGGAIAFANGAQLFTDASTIQVYRGNGVVQVSDTEVRMQVGGTAFRVLSGHIWALGLATKAVGTVPGGFVGAIVYDAGELKRLI